MNIYKYSKSGRRDSVNQTEFVCMFMEACVRKGFKNYNSVLSALNQTYPDLNITINTLYGAKSKLVADGVFKKGTGKILEFVDAEIVDGSRYEVTLGSIASILLLSISEAHSQFLNALSKDMILKFTPDEFEKIHRIDALFTELDEVVSSL